MRSKLFVPGSRPELFDKALAGDADALSFDLEDSVVPERKTAARATLQTLLRSAPRTDKTLIVRVNAADTPWFHDDVAALALPAVQLVNVPKVQSRDDVLQIVQALEAAERGRGDVAPIGLLLNIETPLALRRAHEIAGAHPRVAGLQLGLGDMFEPLQISRRDISAVHQVMLQLRLAAGESGVFVCDGAWADFSDAQGFRAEAEMARRLGYVGKSCIHPKQIALANEIFRPTDAEIADARKVLDAAAHAQQQGVGAWVVDGRMVDAPFLRRADVVMQQARRLSMVTD